MGARRNFSRGGITVWTDKNNPFFGVMAIFRHFKFNLRVFDASTETASENFRVFCTETVYDVNIFKLQGWVGATPGAYAADAHEPELW